MTPITIPDLSRVSLQQLYQRATEAQRLYETALNATVTALGLDPRGAHTLDLATGVLTPETPKNDEPKDGAS